MADARYLIDIILNARDNTGGAVASAAAKLGLLKEEQKGLEQQNQRLGDSFERMTNRINSSGAELRRQQKALGDETGRTVDSQVKLEQASRAYVKTLNDANASEARRVQGLQRLHQAQEQLALDITRLGDEEAKTATAQAKRAAARIGQINTEMERLQAMRSIEQEAIRAQMALDTEAARQRAEQERLGETMAREVEDNNQARHRARMERLNQEALQQRELAEAERQRQQSQQSEFMEGARQRLQAIQNTRRDEEEAGRLREAQNERDLRLGRQYIESIQRIQAIEQERRQAQEGGDFTQVVRLDFDAKAARAEAEELAARLRALFNHIEANIDLDAGSFDAHAAEVIAMKKLLENRVNIDVNMDVDLADIAKVNAMAAATQAVGEDSDESGRRMGFLGGIVRSVGEGFDSSSGRIASFDNFLRGLFSLGIAVFFNQLFLLASAAAGALGALASSAAQAGAALGGALVGGIAQALPVLGVFGAAIYRLKAVFDAANQAQLLQQQQSYQGAKEQKRNADATDAVRSAQERLASSHRNVAAAAANVLQQQKDLSQARVDAASKLRDLILQEEGLTLSMEDNDKAIRRAAARGQTNALPRLFLQRQQIENQQDDTSADIGRRQAGDAPEVVNAQRSLDQAKKSLADARRGADDAERSLARAGRQADIASANITAAAGKLNFLLGRMSAAERHLFETVQKLQDAFRLASQYITEPIIVATDRAFQRIIGFLGDRRILNAARGLAQQMADQGTRMFNTFTSPKMVDDFLFFTKEAGRNLKPLTDIAINIGKSFVDIGVAVAPVLSKIIDWVDGISAKVADFFSQGRKSGELTRFFDQGFTQLKAWGDLLWQIIRLFAAIAGPGGGASSGLKIVRDLADAIGGIADKIDTPGTKLNEFFNRFFRLSRKMLEAMAPVLGSIAHQFDLTFNKTGLDAVQGFAFFLSDILIPAVGQFARFMARATVLITDFAKQHPLVTRIASAFIATALAGSTIARALTIFGPVVAPLKFIAQYLGESTGLMVRMGTIATRLRPLLLGPWGALALAIVLLLNHFGKLDDVWRGLQRAGLNIWEKIRPPIDDLVKSVQDLLDAMGEGKGLLGLLKPLASFIARVLIVGFENLGDAIGDILGGAIRIIGGLLDILTGLLTLDFDKFIGGFKKIGIGLVQGILGPLYQLGDALVSLLKSAWNTLLDWLGIRSPSTRARAIGQGIVDGIIEGAKSIGRALVSLGRWIWDKIRDAIRAEIRGFKAIGNWIWNAIKDAIHAVGDLFSSIGEWIWNTIKAALRREINGFRNIGNWIWNTLSDAIHAIGADLENIGERIIKAIIRGIKKAPGAIKDAIGDLAKKVPDTTPWKGLTPFAAGGPIPGRPHQGFPILAHGGEHMLTAAEVAAAGGHQVIFALRKMLGGGGQGRGGSYRVGGEIQSGGPQVAVSFAGNLGQFAEAWADVWGSVRTSARRGANEVEAQVRDMRVNVSNTLERLYRDMRATWGNIVDSAQTNSRRLARAVGRSIDSMTNTVYGGMDYIGDTTNRVLRSFDAKPVRLALHRPRAEEHASGGMVGQPGERGRDAVLSYLGRGEAVLNWAHQKIVNSALWQTYGTTLPDLFKRTSAYHAGGPETSPGYAVGKPGGDLFDGHPGNVNAGVRRVIETMKRRFPLVVSSTTDHSLMTTSGNVSDHSRGAAVDLSGAVDVMNRAASYVLSSGLARRLKQAIYSGDPQLTWSGGQNVGPGYFGPAVMAQHANHLHLAIVGALRGVFGSAQIRKLLVSGGGALGDIAQAVLDRARKVANNKLNEQTMSVDQHGGTIPAFHGPWVDVMAQIASQKNWNIADWRSLVSGESGGNPAARNPSSGAFGLGQFLGATLQSYAKFGATSTQGEDQIRAMAQYISDRYGNPTNAYHTWLSRNPHWYAMGGPVDGTDGQPVPIVAHAGEWILNKIQQSKLAQLLGTGRDKLRDLLGFTGGPTSFQGGGEVPFATRRERALRRGNYIEPLVDPTTLEGVENEINLVNRALRNMSQRGNLGRRIGRFVSRIRNLTDEDGLLDIMTQEIQDFGDRLSRNLDLARVGLRRVGDRLVRRTALADPVAIAQRTIENQNRIENALRDQRRTADQGLQRTNTFIRQLRRGGIASGEEDRYRTLMAARQKFLDTLDEVDGKIADARQARFDARTERFNAITERDLRGPERRQAQADLASRIANTFGRENAVRNAGADQLDALEDQRRVIRRQLADAQRRSKSDPRWAEVVRDLESKLDDINGSIADQIHANLAAAVDAVNTDIDRRTGMVDIQRRIATTLGRTGSLPGLNQATIDLANEQIGRLTALLPTLRARNDRGLINTVEAQIADLQTKVVETTAQMLQDAVDQIDREATRRGAALDLRGRFADLFERGGNRLGAIQQRQQIGAERQALIRDQIGQLSGALGAAYAQGNQGQIETLTDRIADLNASLQEEIANSGDLVLAYRNAATELIQTRTERGSGIIGTAEQIIQKLGEISGATDNAALLAMAQQVAGVLQGAAQQIIDNIGSAIGGGEFGNAGDSILGQLRNAFAGGPQSFATTLAALGPQIAQLESTMGDTQRAAFQALIQSMIDNTTATLDNTQQIDTLNGTITQPQTWSTTAWQWFREAIFNGMGQVLPRYDMAQVAASGYAGVSSPSTTPPSGTVGGRVQNFNAPLVEVNEAEQGTVDETYLAGRLGFAMKNEGA